MERTETMPTGNRILVVDDEPQIRRFLRTALTHQGYLTSEAGSVHEAITAATAAPPNLVIVDLGLPDGDGLCVVKSLREWTAVPIVVLSVRGKDADKIQALDAGADDYLTKPFSTGELLARLRAARRRSAAQAEEPIFTLDWLEVDMVNGTVSVQGNEVHLTMTELALLKTLIRRAGNVLTHRQLLDIVWGPAYETETQILRVNISNLRRKLEPDPLKPYFILTEPGVGYRFRSPVLR